MKSMIGMAVMVLSATALGAGPPAPSVSLKNFREIGSFLSQATRVSPLDPDVKRVYEKVMGRLPRTGALPELKTSVVMNMLSLSSTYCTKMIAREAKLAPAKRYIHRDVDLSKAPAELTASERRSALEDYSAIFWMRSITDDEAGTLGLVMDELLKTEESPTLNVFLSSVCSAVASNLDFLTY